MNKKKIYEIISRIIKAPISKINVNSKSSDFVKWDSIAQVKIFVSIEKLIKKKIDPKHMEKLRSIKNIINFINKN